MNQWTCSAWGAFGCGSGVSLPLEETAYPGCSGGDVEGNFGGYDSNFSWDGCNYNVNNSWYGDQSDCYGYETQGGDGITGPDFCNFQWEGTETEQSGQGPQSLRG